MGLGAVVGRHRPVAQTSDEGLETRQGIAQPMDEVRGHRAHRPGLGGQHQFTVGACQPLAAFGQHPVDAGQSGEGDGDGHRQRAAREQQGEEALTPQSAIQAGVLLEKTGALDLHSEDAHERRGGPVGQGDVHPQDRGSVGRGDEFLQHLAPDKPLESGRIGRGHGRIAEDPGGQRTAGVEHGDPPHVGQLWQGGHLDGGQERIVDPFGPQGGETALEQRRQTPRLAVGQARAEFAAQFETGAEHRRHEHPQGRGHGPQGGTVHPRSALGCQNSHSSPPVAVCEV